MKVSAFRTGDGGCDFYRCVLPLEAAANAKKITYKELWAEKIIADIMLEKNKFDMKMDADIYLAQRLTTFPFLKRIREYSSNHNPDSRIIVDFDDNVFKV